MIPTPIKNFVEVFSQIPSIGPRKARRLSFYLTKKGDSDFKEIKKALSDLERLDKCPKCFFVKRKKEKLCEICLKSNRSNKKIAIVEKETDLISLEKAENFKGTYFIVGQNSASGSLTEKQKSRIEYLKKRIKKSDQKAKELIVATSPTTQGDFLAKIIKEKMEGFAEKITRLGRGLPTGGEVEFADRETLRKALERRN
ncbi:MAG: toprim domain-containing protein [Candidatus Magasanikbacteria bacterium]